MEKSNAINSFRGQKKKLLKTSSECRFHWRFWFYSEGDFSLSSKTLHFYILSIFHFERDELLERELHFNINIQLNGLGWIHAGTMWLLLTEALMGSELLLYSWWWTTWALQRLVLWMNVWACGLRHSRTWVCTVTAFNTAYLFLFVPAPGGLLLGQGLDWVNEHVWSERAQDVSQISQFLKSQQCQHQVYQNNKPLCIWTIYGILSTVH